MCSLVRSNLSPWLLSTPLNTTPVDSSGPSLDMFSLDLVNLSISALLAMKAPRAYKRDNSSSWAHVHTAQAYIMSWLLKQESFPDRLLRGREAGTWLAFLCNNYSKYHTQTSLPMDYHIYYYYYCVCCSCIYMCLSVCSVSIHSHMCGGQTLIWSVFLNQSPCYWQS